MTSPKPLTREELERIRLGLDVIEEQARNGLAFVGGRISRGVIDQRLVKLVEMAAKSLTLESELAQLRREKAEREELYSRRDAWICGGPLRNIRHGRAFRCDEESLEYVLTLSEDYSRGAAARWKEGRGPTYEDALAAALENR